MNAQNEHIMQKLAEAQQAVSELIAAGMTVTHINIEGARPRINVQTPRHNHDLPVSVKVIKPKPMGGRQCEMAACVGGCEIHWREEDYR